MLGTFGNLFSHLGKSLNFFKNDHIGKRIKKPLTNRTMSKEMESDWKKVGESLRSALNNREEGKQNGFDIEGD